MKILVTAPYNKSSLNELIESGHEVIYKPWKERGQPYNSKEMSELINKNNIEGIIAEIDEVNANVIENSPLLNFIGICRANPVNVDIDVANKKNIPVFNTPARNAQAVTELLISNLISFYRNIIPSNTFVRENYWTESNTRPYLKFRGNEVAGKTIGFVGFGAVGQTVANILKNFPSDIQYYDPFVTNVDSNYKNVELEELFKTSDIVSIHLPVNDSTRNLIDKRLIESMKSDAVFVNTARSAVVDYEALYNVLSQEQIRGAILDVFDNEPPKELETKLISLSNVLATPHIAGASYEVENHHSRIMNNNLFSWFESGNANNIFNRKNITL